MKIRVSKNTPELFSVLMDEIHDRYFNLRNVTFDDRTSEFRIYFGQSKKDFDRMLHIFGVRNYRLIKDQGIEIYMINKLIIDPDKHSIILETCECLSILFLIDPDFKVEVSHVNDAN